MAHDDDDDDDDKDISECLILAKEKYIKRYDKECLLTYVSTYARK
jgi:hypothetical protein